MLNRIHFLLYYQAKTFIVLLALKLEWQIHSPTMYLKCHYSFAREQEQIRAKESVKELQFDD